MKKQLCSFDPPEKNQKRMKKHFLAKSLRTGSLNHFWRSAWGMVKCPAAFMEQSFRAGWTGSRTVDISGSGLNFGCIAPTWPRDVFHSSSQTPNKKVWVLKSQTPTKNLPTPGLQKFVFDLCDCILKDLWAICFGEACHMANIIKALHQFTGNLSRQNKQNHTTKKHIVAIGNTQKGNPEKLITPKPIPKEPKKYQVPAFSKVPSYMVLWWMIHACPLSEETFERQPSKIALMVLGEAIHWAVSCLSFAGVVYLFAPKTYQKKHPNQIKPFKQQSFTEQFISVCQWSTLFMAEEGSTLWGNIITWFVSRKN